MSFLAERDVSPSFRTPMSLERPCRMEYFTLLYSFLCLHGLGSRMEECFMSGSCMQQSLLNTGFYCFFTGTVGTPESTVSATDCSSLVPVPPRPSWNSLLLLPNTVFKSLWFCLSIRLRNQIMGRKPTSSEWLRSNQLTFFFSWWPSKRASFRSTNTKKTSTLPTTSCVCLSIFWMSYDSLWLLSVS